MVGVGGWIGVVLAAVLVLLLLAELALRARARSLRPLTPWHSWEMHHKVVAIDEVARAGGASVVVVGSSMVNAAVDPYRLTELLGMQRPVFNGGLNGAGTQLLERWILRIVVPRLRPEIVVIGLGSHEVSSGNVVARRLLDGLLTSPAWRALDGRRSVTDWLERWSILYRYRRYLGRRRMFNEPRQRRAATCRRLGMPRGLLFFRYREYRIDERQLPIWHQLVADYDVGGEEMAALRRIIDGVRGAGAVPILVRMPVTSDWVDMHPQGARDFRRFADALESFARVNGVAYADIASRFASLDDFADPVHLNGKGLARFTDALAGSIAQITSRGRA